MCKKISCFDLAGQVRPNCSDPPGSRMHGEVLGHALRCTRHEFESREGTSRRWDNVDNLSSFLWLQNTTLQLHAVTNKWLAALGRPVLIQSDPVWPSRARSDPSRPMRPAPFPSFKVRAAGRVCLAGSMGRSFLLHSTRRMLWRIKTKKVNRILFIHLYTYTDNNKIFKFY